MKKIFGLQKENYINGVLLKKKKEKKLNLEQLLHKIIEFKKYLNDK